MDHIFLKHVQKDTISNVFLKHVEKDIISCTIFTCTNVQVQIVQRCIFRRERIPKHFFPLCPSNLALSTSKEKKKKDMSQIFTFRLYHFREKD